MSAETCGVSLISSVHDCFFNRNIRGNSVIVGHFNEPIVKTRVNSGVPTQGYRQKFRENRNVSIIELNDQVSTIECRNTIFKHAGVIKNPKLITVNVTDFVKIEYRDQNLHLEPWKKTPSGTQIIQNELGNIEKGFLDRSSESIDRPWWEFWVLSEKNKKKLLISSIFAMIVLSFGLFLSTKWGRKQIFNLLKTIFLKLWVKCRNSRKISNKSDGMEMKKLDSITEEPEIKPRKLSITI